MHMRQLSIIIPTFNQEAYLSQTLLSVKKQNYNNWECIIVDDGSTDSTKKIVEKFITEDSRFTYYYQQNQGPSAARNYGISKSNGEYILPLDSDDLISANYIKDAIDILEKNPRVKLVYCEAVFFGEKTGPWLLPDYSYKKMLLENVIFCSAVYRKSDYLKTKGYDNTMRSGLEDWDFWLSILKKEDSVFKISETHFFYRIRKMSRNFIINSNFIILFWLRLKIYSKHFRLYDFTSTLLYFLKTFYFVACSIKSNLTKESKG